MSRKWSSQAAKRRYMKQRFDDIRTGIILVAMIVGVGLATTFIEGI